MSNLGLPIQAALISVSGSLLIAIAIWFFGRRRDQRNLTMELHKQYYSPEIAKARLDCRRFVTSNCNADWSKIDPYSLLAEEVLKDGYSEVVRYFHRLGALYKENEIRKSLARRLLAREFGFWYTFLFQPMADRDDWWTKEAILGLLKLFDEDEGKIDFEKGAISGRERRAKAKAQLEVAAKGR